MIVSDTYIDTQHNHQCFHHNWRNYAFPQVGEWVSDVILGDQEGGMRLLYHPEGESTRFCSTFIFTAKYQIEKDSFALSLSQGKDHLVKSKQSPAELRIRSAFHLSLYGHFRRKNVTPMNSWRLQWYFALKKSPYIWHIRPDKEPNPDISPMMKAKDKPYFADTLPFLMLSRWLNDEKSKSSFPKMSWVRDFLC